MNLRKENKNLAQFLIKDYIEDMKKMGNYEIENLLIANFQTASLGYKKLKVILNFIDNIYSSIFLIVSSFKKKKRKKVLFIGNRYSSIILAANKSYNVEMIVGGKEDRLFAIKNFIKYDSFSDLDQFVYNYLIKKDESYLAVFAKEIGKRIKKIKPEYVVLWNDCLPIERAVVMACKEFGIATLEIQHGIYDSSFSLSTGKVVDCVLVWGKYFRDLYVKQNLRKSEDIYVLGYPYLIANPKMVVPTVKPSRKNNHYSVYYLGQNFKICSKEFLNIEMESIRKIYEICNKLGMRLIYRPHPGDDRAMLKEKFSEICFSPKKAKIEDSIANGDVFISIISTSLIEAAMRSKISLQLMNCPLKLDNFEKLGACNKSFKSLIELENYLLEISKAKSLDTFKSKFNNDYIETRYNSGQRFLEIIKDIEKR